MKKTRSHSDSGVDVIHVCGEFVNFVFDVFRFWVWSFTLGIHVIYTPGIYNCSYNPNCISPPYAILCYGLVSMDLFMFGICCVNPIGV